MLGSIHINDVGNAKSQDPYQTIPVISLSYIQTQRRFVSPNNLSRCRVMEHTSEVKHKSN